MVGCAGHGLQWDCPNSHLGSTADCCLKQGKWPLWIPMCSCQLEIIETSVFLRLLKKLPEMDNWHKVLCTVPDTGQAVRMCLVVMRGGSCGHCFLFCYRCELPLTSLSVFFLSMKQAWLPRFIIYVIFNKLGQIIDIFAVVVLVS